ncbi:MAG: PAS domain-containing protein [Verrucomicrobiota bacterium]
MRRQSDFVLEKAGWPALLLEENGAICRANHAARQLFGAAVQGLPGVTSLASFLDDANGVKLDRFLADQAAGQAGDLKLNLPGGQKARFQARATKISRDGQNYFILQLFSGPESALSDTAAWTRSREGKDFSSSSPTSFLDAMEVPFALTNSDWPALVVDKLGTIIRSNPAAARVFGAAARKSAALGLIWPPENTLPLEKLLSSPMHGEAQLVKVRAESGTVLPFLAQACPAAQSKWVLLQFFKESLPAPAAAAAASGGQEKPGEEFLLQEADWPAFLLRKNGQVVRANRAAVRAFGSGVEKQDVKLSAIWSPENRDSLEQFLSLPAPSAPPRLKFRLKSGLPAVFLVQLSSVAAEDVFLLQLLKDPGPVGGAHTPSSPAGTAPGGGLESHTAQRQKLDCALQLARSVALDFNNALTSILGHSSLLLSQAEPDHPWRGSLVQIEKSAAKAAEVASDLGSFSLPGNWSADFSPSISTRPRCSRRWCEFWKMPSKPSRPTARSRWRRATFSCPSQPRTGPRN